MMLKKLDLPRGLPRGKAGKQSVLYLIIIIVIAVLVCVGFFYYISRTKIEEKPEEKKPTGKTMKEILESLSAPEGTAEPISEETRENLSAPSGNSNAVSQDILDSLSAPE